MQSSNTIYESNFLFELSTERCQEFAKESFAAICGEVLQSKIESTIGLEENGRESSQIGAMET